MKMFGKFAAAACVGVAASLPLASSQAVASATPTPAVSSSACPLITFTQSVAIDGDKIIATFAPNFTSPAQNTLTFVDFHLSQNCSSNLTVSNTECATPFDNAPFSQLYALNVHNPVMGGASNMANYALGVFTYNFNFTAAGLSASDSLCYAFTYAFSTGDQCNTGMCGLLNGVSGTPPPASLPTGLVGSSGQRSYYPASPLDLTLPNTTFIKNITAVDAPAINNTFSNIGVEAILADITALQYALTLENLADAFYIEFQSNLTRQNFTDAGLPSNTFDLFNLIANHESTHVATLRALIIELGAVPVPYCTYNFSAVTNMTTYVGMSRVLQNSDVMAYDGSIAAINSDWLKQAAATIATVEARFAAYLNQLVGLLPFPTAADIPLTPQEVLFGTAYPIIVSCPYEIQIPFNHSLTGYQYFNASNVTLPNSGLLYPSSAGPIGAASSTATGLQIVNETIATVTGVAPSAACLSKVKNADIRALQYALTLENIADAFYSEFNFTRANYTDAGLPSSAYDMNNLIATEEHQHVVLLSAMITDLGAVPVTHCTYNFSMVTDINTFIALSRTLQNNDVSAYDGAISAINDDTLRQAAATLATVEARYASYLNLLVGLNPFPAAADTPVAPLEVLLGLDSPILISCPYEIQLPERVVC